VSRFAVKNPSFLLSNLLTTAEERQTEYDTALLADERRREEEAQREAQALAEAKRLSEEQAAARAAEEAKKRETLAILAKEFGYVPIAEPVIHAMVRIKFFIIELTDRMICSPVPPVRHLERPAKVLRERPVRLALASMALVL
jgi:hypothetical protein